MSDLVAGQKEVAPGESGERPELTTSWLASALGRDVSSFEVKGAKDKISAASELVFLDAHTSQGTEKLVLKRHPLDMPDHRKNLGLAREALFYDLIGAGLREVVSIPRCHYARGDLASGEMEILLESLEDAVPAGVFFGPGNPNNWALQSELAALSQGNPGAREIAEAAFKMYAGLHSKFWGDRSLMEKKWLRGHDWMSGDGADGWQTAQQIAVDGWKQMRAADPPLLDWDEHLVKCLDVSFAKVDWAVFQKEVAARPFSLVHGDAHPHNFLYVQQRTPDAHLVMIDFEMVGLGSPAQELGQFLISHMTPEERRLCERELVALYHRELVAGLKKGGQERAAAEYSLDQCWKEYVDGGVGRWAWFVPLFRGAPKPLTQYFHDQVAAFLRDHIPNPEDSPMPRV